ncbi:linear amide C-N hydrolase [Tundrisphaera lichenicola]|uniref:linear amide C-N hydrolase n=1 Tax=Tundrisphaera lichenicola TaxID=2029860 RepID=UPI003EB7D6E2
MLRTNRLAIPVIIVLVAAFGLTSLVEACSRVLWSRPGQPVIVGRSMDWFEPMGTNLWAFPRGIERAGLAGPNSLKWSSRYGSVVASVYDIASADGINEAGLAAQVLWLAESDYGKRDESTPALSISLWTQYYLDNFATVAEAVEAARFAPYQVVPVEVGTSVKRPSTVHLSLADRSGDSAVIEFLDGKPVIHHGRQFAVMTNSPSFDRQLELARQYQGLGGEKPLPGTTDPADRFARASYYTEHLPDPKSEREALAGVFSVMRNVSAPFGTVDAARPNVSTTLWRTVADLTHGVYYFESTTSPNVIWARLSELDLSPDRPVLKLDLANQPELVGDVTAEFRPFRPFSFAPANP